MKQLTNKFPHKLFNRISTKQQSILYLNRFLAVLLILGGIGAIALAIAVDFIGRGGLSGFGARQFMLVLSGFSLIGTGVAIILPEKRKYIGEWFLIGVATITVAMAADLIIINTGLPRLSDKVLGLASVVVGIALIRLVPVLPAVWENSENLPEMIVSNRSSIGNFIVITIQLGLLVVVIQQFNLENQAFSHNIMLLTFFGFLIHFFLPLNYRLPFFLILSLTGIAGVLGFSTGVWLVGLGLVLISICHLPVSYSARVAFLLIAGIILAILRMDWIQVPWSAAVWPILGSMFMFRLIVYLYDLKHQKEPVSIARTLSYFFLLPNVVFPLFPVVDFSTFRRTYYNSERYQIYQKGVNWIFRGALHLILYRFVNYYLLIAPEAVTNVGELIQYLVSNFLLYLRVSGQFHIIVGILHLFGFNLPETHHLYYLASSFTDFWRRINIYWKDFMQKIFYYPIYFKLRQKGTTIALVLSTLFVFLMTWFLHAYQWFWLRGTFLLVLQDMTFWFLLAIFVIINILYEVKRGRKRTLGKKTRTLKDVASQSLRIGAIFTIICILWSLWSSESLLAWLSLWLVEGETLPEILRTVFLVVLPIFVGMFVVAGLYLGIMPNNLEQGKQALTTNQKPSPFFKPALVSLGLILIVFFVGKPVVYAQIGGETRKVLSDLQVDRLSSQDADLLVKGYYEDLTGVNRFNSQLWEVYTKRPGDLENFDTSEAARLTNDFLKIDLRPNIEMTFMNQTFQTNRWGIRDQDYEMLPSPGTYRVALLGASTVMGWGVADEETFEWVLEERLNQENSGEIYEKYEILNFSVSGYSTLDRLVVFENKALSFKPNAVFYVGHPNESGRSINNLVERIHSGVAMPYEELIRIVNEAEVNKDTAEAVATRRLNPYGDEIVFWAYRRIVELSQQQDILPVFILMPRIVGINEYEENAKVARMAEEAGFIVLDLSDVYDNYDIDSIRLTAWDWHPNARGQQLIADRLYEALRENSQIIPLELSSWVE